MTKEQRIIKAQETKIADLTNEIKELKSDLELARKGRDRAESELKDVHATFDLLGVPRRVSGTYYDLAATSRLTLFLAQANGIKVEQPKDSD